MDITHATQPDTPAVVAKPRKRHRVFWWIFLAIQIIFLIWIIVGVHGNASGQGASVHAQAVSYCSNNGWQGLYKSYSQCVTQYGNTLNGASDVGTSIGVGLVIGLWVAVDVIVGITYLIYRLAKRPAR